MFDFVYSDPHFTHKNIIKYCARPFDSVEHQISELRRRYNDVVSETDTVLWMGDCFLPKDPGFVHGLKGKKWLLRGNHDRKISDKAFIQLGFSVVFQSYLCTTLHGHNLVFSHYPYPGYSEDKRYERLRPERTEGWTIVHGHTHETSLVTGKGTLCVCVDATDFAPLPVSKLLEVLNGSSVGLYKH